MASRDRATAFTSFLLPPPRRLCFRRGVRVRLCVCVQNVSTIYERILMKVLKFHTPPEVQTSPLDFGVDSPSLILPQFLPPPP